MITGYSNGKQKNQVYVKFADFPPITSNIYFGIVLVLNIFGNNLRNDETPSSVVIIQ